MSEVRVRKDPSIINKSLQEAYKKHQAHKARTAPEIHGNSIDAMMADGCLPLDLRRKYIENSIKSRGDYEAMDTWARAAFMSAPGQSELWRKEELDDPEFDT